MSTLFGSGLPRPAVRVAPGVAHLPGWLPLAAQTRLVDQARGLARSVAGGPHAMTRPVLSSGRMSVHVLALGQPWPPRPHTGIAPVPDNYGELARAGLTAAAQVAGELAPWTDVSFRAEATLLNYYPPDATMGMHIDADEPSRAPVISLSIGDDAIFRMGNTEHRGRPWDDITLLSGDLVVFGGPARRAYHGVPAVREGTAPEGCGVERGRINITIRQVRE